MTLKSVCILLAAVAVFDVTVGWYLPLSTPEGDVECSRAEECTSLDVPDRDNLASEPALVVPFLLIAKVDDERSGCEAALAPRTEPSPATPPIADVAIAVQRPPISPCLHVLCTYLS